MVPPRATLLRLCSDLLYLVVCFDVLRPTKYPTVSILGGGTSSKSPSLTPLEFHILIGKFKVPPSCSRLLP